MRIWELITKLETLRTEQNHEDVSIVIFHDATQCEMKEGCYTDISSVDYDEDLREIVISLEHT